MQPPVLERIGVGYLRRRAPAVCADVRGAERPRTHVLTADEQRSMRVVERDAITAGTVAGAFFGLIAGAGEMLARHLYGADGAGDKVAYWSVVGGFAALSSVLEVIYLYWSGLRSVHRLAQVAGVDLFPGGAHGERVSVASALARAALELPNPRQPVYGIDPMRRASRLRMALGTLAYKAKIGLTNFVLKAILRRMLIRALLRAWLPMIAVPVVAAWNGVICWRVMREARIRAMGPSAARELVDGAFASASELSAEGKHAAWCAAGSAVVHKRDMHPNIVALLNELATRLGEPVADGLDEATAMVESLRELGAPERRVVLDVLVAAVVLDGRVTRSERELLERAHVAAGIPLDFARVEARARAFVAGQHMTG
jgi:hypothetical protein